MSSSAPPYRCEPPYHRDPGEPNRLLTGQKMYLVCGRLVRKPGLYTSWPSADTQYKHVSGATVKRYHNYDHLLAAWHARCDLGEHDHPVDPRHGNRAHDRTPSPPPSSPSLSSPALPASPASPAPPSPPLRLYYIHSRSPSRTPSPIPRTPSPVSALTHEALPAYTAIFGNRSPLGPSVANSTNSTSIVRTSLTREEHHRARARGPG
ncbi:hypothetical protein B0H14DRAFT_3492368 [Mycena olivaceomarginata]|nr:hypothetical protein B0H14DRAFT_3492368 [Mycena olivaceomarginata]